ncbi:MAG: PorP/SprF family type IX secretion system membrane protein, partial [Flavobacteriales bacterium]
MRTANVIKILLVPAFLICCISESLGQNFHLTQFKSAPMYFNPALTGTFTGINQPEDANYRVATDMRSQWKSLGLDPYNTGYIAYERQLDRYGVGGYILDNSSGSDSFNLLQFHLSGNYNITERGSDHLLTAGIQLGVFHKTINPENFRFESQYSPSAGGFDMSLPNKENISKSSKTNFDANVGVYYQYNESRNRFRPFGGVSVFHLNKPDEAIYASNKNTSMRWVGMLGSEITINDKIEIQPSILYMNQAKAQERYVVLDGIYALSDKYSILGGFGYRLEDAATVQLGLKRNNNLIRFSYDINTSYLDRYTNGAG